MLIYTEVLALGNNFIFTPVNTSSGLSDNQIRYILQLSDGRMVFTTSGNVNIYDGSHFSYIHRSTEHIYHLNGYEGHYRIYQDGDSLLWIKDQYKLMCINLYEEKYEEKLEIRFRKVGVEKTVVDMFLDNQSRMWLLTVDGLLQTYNSDSFDLSFSRGKLQDLQTTDNHLYLFYNTGEVVCYDLKTRERLYNIAAYPETEQVYFEKTSLVVKGEKGFYQLRNGTRGGFFFFDPQNRVWEKILDVDYVLNTLIITPQETVYISTVNGIWRIEEEQKQYIPVLRTTTGDNISTEISTLFYDRQGGLWVGTFNKGLLYYHPSRYKFIDIGRSSFPEQQGGDLIIEAFAEDNNGNIFFKSQSNIYQYDNNTINEKKVVSVSPFSLSGDVHRALYRQKERIYQGNLYNALCFDTRGWVWAGTSDGLELFISEKQKKQTFYVEDGLSNNFVQALLEDKNNNIWVTTSHGISHIQVDSVSNKLRFINYNLLDGTLEGEYAIGSAFEATDGKLYFGGVDGFNVLNPDQLASSYLPFKPVLTEFSLFGEKIEQGKKYGNRILLTKTTPYTTNIELAYNQNFLSFDFSALNYRNQAQTFYSYQLEGVDANWQEISVGKQGREIGANGILHLVYTNLPPGKYQLKVKASDNATQWDDRVTEISITIYAPWWKTTIAYIIYSVLFLFIVIAGVRIYISITKKKIERQHKEDILLLRIRSLIEQCNQYEKEGKHRSYTEDCTLLVNEESSSDSDKKQENSADSVFISKAMDLVERNLNNSNYSVEQLSRDLCMERTGLYRKLITLLDQSPSLFIRNIRLQKAAQLILENKLSITEVSERVGFSSASYLSKCFQEMYGCKPSEYGTQYKQSE
ncbi:two-component regulator propeller domain-containing protein [Dysgonomonas sp. 216]|uniref:two-component regulator propeller domain-containing protein n=1 Tax=Dysgonomonas sp. 216 TaxID=2302934 RepID=UPI0021057033|nr:two-component regulator propeller domain-containing protein [Dysgonomonas sp. 216]